MTKEEFNDLRPGDEIIYKGEKVKIIRLAVAQITYFQGIVFKPSSRKNPITMYNYQMVEKER